MVKNIKWSVADFLENSYFLNINLDEHTWWFKLEFLKKKNYIDYFLQNEFNSKNLHKLIVFYLKFKYEETDLDKLNDIVSNSGDSLDFIILDKHSKITFKIERLNYTLNKLWTTDKCLEDNMFVYLYFSFMTDLYWLLETINIFFESYDYVLDVDYTDTEIFKLLKYNRKNYERKQNKILKNKSDKK